MEHAEHGHGIGGEQTDETPEPGNTDGQEPTGEDTPTGAEETPATGDESGASDESDEVDDDLDEEDEG